MMTGKERYLTALKGGMPDRVPLHEFHWGLPFIESVLGKLTGPYHNADDEVAVARATGIDMVWTAPFGFMGFMNIQWHGDSLVDEWGVWWGSNAQSFPSGWPEKEVISNRDDWKKLRIPDPRLPERVKQPQRFVELAGGELAVIGGLRGPFSATWMLAGLVNMGLWLYDDPDLLDEMLSAMADWYTELGLQLIAAGVDAIVIHDDWGMNNATFIKPNDWRVHVYPHIARQVETLANTGVPVILHSDGNLNAILDDIVQLKISALNPLQRSANMSLLQTKQKYGDRLCLIGNISTTTTLAHGSPDDVEREVLECLRDGAPGGGYILAPDHSYHSGVPIESTWRVLETVKKYGAYPLELDVIADRLTQLQLNTNSVTP